MYQNNTTTTNHLTKTPSLQLAVGSNGTGKVVMMCDVHYFDV
jgi:hypothetical protein